LRGSTKASWRTGPEHAAVNTDTGNSERDQSDRPKSEVDRLRALIADPSFRLAKTASTLRHKDQHTVGYYLRYIGRALSYSIPILGFLGRERRFPLTSHAARFELLLVFQHLIALTCITVSSFLGASSFFLVPGAIVFYLTLCILNVVALGTDQPNSTPLIGRLIWAFGFVGAFVVGAALLLTLYAAWLRVGDLQLSTLSASLGLVLLACPLLIISAVKFQHTPWIYLTSTLTAIPLLLAWGTASAVVTRVKPIFVANALALNDPPERVLAERQRWATFRGWRTPDGLPLTVIVALSGGGYRAAAIHAGLLQAFDENCVPIRYLTTVSGGSIFGAYYALGNTPGQFETLLETSKPGLPDKFLSIPYLPLNWWKSNWSNSDTYSEHLDSIFFHGKTLGDTGLAPQLILNATDIVNTNSTAVREIFYKGRNPAYPQLDQTPLADVVAASAAFPGAFQPKSVVWPLGAANGPPEERRFVDGGVVENLGYSGWQRFVQLQKLALPSEGVLLISDAGADVSSGGLPAKIDLMTLLSRSQDIAYEEQQMILKQYIRDKSESLHPDFIRAQESLASFSSECYLKEALRCVVEGAAAARDVSQYSTLSELDPGQVRRAFWVGYTMGKQHWALLDQWRRENSLEERSCPDAGN
jgi:predicted acylesterase/phospholipase RssA